MKNIINKFNSGVVHILLVSLVSLGLVIAVALFVFQSNTGDKIQSSSKLEKENVTIWLKWLHQAQFAGLYVAREKNYFAEKGIRVTLERGGIDRPSIQNVIDGNAQIGVAGADDLLKAIDRGENLIAIAVIYKLNPAAFMVLDTSPIKTPRDFVGKTVGIQRGAGTELSYISILENLSINRRAINEKEVGYNLEELFEGSVDVWPVFRINEPFVAESKGYKVRLIKPEDWGVVMYGDVLFARRDFVEQNPELTKNIVQASIQGWQHAIENIDEGVDHTMKYAETERVFQEKMLTSSIPLIYNSTSRLGEMSGAIWQSMIDFLKNTHAIEGNFNAETVFTNEFLQEL